MKHFLLFVFLSFFLMFDSSAQLFTGGVKAGIVGSQIDGDTYSGFNKAGIFGGGYVNLRIADIEDSPVENHIQDDSIKFHSFWDLSAFQMELAYMQKGSRKNPNYEKEDFEQYLLRTDYVELAILYQFLYSEKLAFELGPAFGYLMHTYEERDQQIAASVPFRKTVVNYIGGIYYFLNDRTGVNLRVNNSILSLRDADRKPYDKRRFFHYGQFHVALVLSVQFRL